MNLAKLGILAAALLMAGCGDLLSLRALFSDQDKLFDARLEGRWDGQDDLLIVERAGGNYSATMQSKNNPAEKAKYEVHLVDIGGVHFADVLPADGIGHMFLKLNVTGDKLHLSFFDSEWLRDRIPHAEADVANGKKQAVLTDRTPELRNLVAKFASEPKAYDEEILFQRMK